MQHRKIIAIVLSLCCVLPLFVSCSDNGTANPDTMTETVADMAEETEQPKLTDNLPETDMDGWVLPILNYTAESLSWANTSIVVEAIDGDVLNDALFTRVSAIENRFNAGITVTDVGDPIAALKKNVPSGDTTYDVYPMFEGSLGNCLLYVSSWNHE